MQALRCLHSLAHYICICPIILGWWKARHDFCLGSRSARACKHVVDWTLQHSMDTGVETITAVFDVLYRSAGYSGYVQDFPGPVLQSQAVEARMRSILLLF